MEEVEPRPFLWALLLVPVAAFGWLAGELTSTAVVQQFCFVALVVILIWGIIGRKAARTLAAPLLFLFFAVPAGEALIPLLQDYSAWSAVKLLDLTGVPVLLQGRLITIPSGKWEVAEACSGIHYLLAMVTVGFVYVDFMYRKWSRRAIFLAACVVVPVVANGIRVYGILLTDYLGGTKLARGTDHLIAGGLFLTVITILLFAAGARWRENGAPPSQGETAASGHGWREGASHRDGKPLLRLLAFATIGFAAAAAAPAVAKSANAEEGKYAAVLKAPVVTIPWAPTGDAARGEFSGWRPKLLPADAEFEQSYAKQGRLVALRIAFYGPSGREAKLVSSSNSLYEKPEWLRTGEKSVEIKMDGVPVRVRQVSISSDERRLVLWTWYWVDGESTSNGYEAKWLLAWARLKGRSRGSAEIVLAAEDSPVGESGESLLRDFSEHLSLRESLNAAETTESNQLFEK